MTEIEKQQAWDQIIRDFLGILKPTVRIEQSHNKTYIFIENSTQEIITWADNILSSRQHCYSTYSWVVEDLKIAEQFKTLFYLKWGQ